MPNVITAREGTIMVTMAVRVMHVNELTEIEVMEMTGESSPKLVALVIVSLVATLDYLVP